MRDEARDVLFRVDIKAPSKCSKRADSPSAPQAAAFSRSEELVRVMFSLRAAKAARSPS